ncbi:PC4/YdbC family ssDNA-binding protein [candidate division KSB1 bacterium]
MSDNKTIQTVGSIKKNALHRLFIRINEYQGATICDIRLNYKDDSSQWQPTPKGVSIQVSQLPELIRLLEVTEKYCVDHKLLNPDSVTEKLEYDTKDV